MFKEVTEQRLKCFIDDLIEITYGDAEIVEENIEGYAKVQLKSDKRLIVFKKMEKNKLQNLKYKNCADFIVFEEKEKNINVHIFEMKRTVRLKEWDHIKAQFTGALLNAYALAGILEEMIEKNNIYFYTCFRRDSINSPIGMRTVLSNRKDEMDGADWFSNNIILRNLSHEKYKHIKIQLGEENDCAVYSLN